MARIQLCSLQRLNPSPTQLFIAVTGLHCVRCWYTSRQVGKYSLSAAAQRIIFVQLQCISYVHLISCLAAKTSGYRPAGGLLCVHQLFSTIFRRRCRRVPFDGKRNGRLPKRLRRRLDRWRTRPLASARGAGRFRRHPLLFPHCIHSRSSPFPCGRPPRHYDVTGRRRPRRRQVLGERSGRNICLSDDTARLR